ncbi:MAG: type VI secretion system tube protein Hcp [Pantoea sp.]|uniref:Hcp family type VI secretion system effector n=1 Tax=unclassified Pantoea TaxID=2630326 RepID=UPI00238E5E76|nr:type VI secretion system tube protein Hcp [Pantoea sp.]MDE1185342.1 type VI secretion system tube protein Hcp [Pantoea sp.]
MNSLFLKVEGVAGESKDASHPGWIDIKNYSWGAWRSGNGPGMGNYRNLIVHTQIDKATPALILMTTNGKKIRKVEMSACKAGFNQAEYYRITLENVLVFEAQLRDDSHTTHVEYEFQADIVKIQYWEQTSAGIKGAETRSGWNIKENRSEF